jgi:hypothetical protein
MAGMLGALEPMCIPFWLCHARAKHGPRSKFECCALAPDCIKRPKTGIPSPFFSSLIISHPPTKTIIAGSYLAKMKGWHELVASKGLSQDLSQFVTKLKTF